MNKKAKQLAYGHLIQKKHKPSWYWRYYDKATGYQKYRSTKTTDQQEAFKIADVWAIQYLAEEKGLIKKARKKESVLFEQVCLDWFKVSCPDWKPFYALEVKKLINGYIMPFFGKIPVSEIHTKHIREFKAEMQATVSGGTVNRRLTVLKQILEMAVEDDLIENMPIIRRCSEHNAETGRALNDDEIRRLLDAARQINPDFVRFVALGVFAGLRHSEILSREWRHIDFKNRLILFEDQKNKTSMSAPMPEVLRKILLEVPEPERRGFVVCYIGKDGLRVPADKMYKTWRQCVKLAGIEWCSPHDLRRTFVTRYYQKFGLEAKHASRHSEVAAMQIYVKQQPGEILAAADEVFEGFN